mmetsp:Transcript_2599/g.7035  ORF Transcript_2599/g.7035 Transcript_2599/m.7035 type:complete len:222 (+) Transcript_2599:19-684(+)
MVLHDEVSSQDITELLSHDDKVTGHAHLSHMLANARAPQPACEYVGSTEHAHCTCARRQLRLHCTVNFAVDDARCAVVVAAAAVVVRNKHEGCTLVLVRQTAAWTVSCCLCHQLCPGVLNNRSTHTRDADASRVCSPRSFGVTCCADIRVVSKHRDTSRRSFPSQSHVAYAVVVPLQFAEVPFAWNDGRHVREVSSQRVFVVAAVPVRSLVVFVGMHGDAS